MYTYQYQKVDRHQEKLKGFSHAAFHFQRKYLQQQKSNTPARLYLCNHSFDSLAQFCFV